MTGPARIVALSWFSVCVGSVLVDVKAEEPARRLVVRGNGSELGETPIVAELKTPLASGRYSLRREGKGPTIVAQVYEEGGKTRIALILDRLKPDESAMFTMEGVQEHSPKNEVSIGSMGPLDFKGKAGGSEPSNVPIELNGKLFSEYRTDVGPKPFLFPLIGPTGTSYTRAYPMRQVEGEDRDHPHQRSFWFTHGKVNGIDFWSEERGHGSIKETSRKRVIEGPVMGEFRTANDWLGPDGKLVCQDERVLRFYNTKTIRVVDFEITIKASRGPVTFGDTKEGMFGLRVASTMDVKRKLGGKITNAEGLTDLEAWGKASPWVDYVGPVEGKTVGVAILNHPRSFRFPTTWHVRDYGLFAANPFGWHDFGRKEPGDHTLAAGETLSFGYRVILHEGDTPSARIGPTFQGYASPPSIKVIDEAK